MSGLANTVNLWGPLAQGLGMGADISRSRRLDEDRRLAMQQQQAMAEREMVMREAEAQRRGVMFDQSQRSRAAFQRAVPGVLGQMGIQLPLPEDLDPEVGLQLGQAVQADQFRREDRQIRADDRQQQQRERFAAGVNVQNLADTLGLNDGNTDYTGMDPGDAMGLMRMRLGERQRTQEFERQRMQQEGIARMADQEAQRLEQQMTATMRTMGLQPGTRQAQAVQDWFGQRINAAQQKAQMARMGMDLSAGQLLGSMGGGSGPNMYIPGTDPRQDSLIEQRTRTMAQNDPSVRGAKLKFDTATRALEKLYANDLAGPEAIAKAEQRAMEAQEAYETAFEAAMGRIGQPSGETGELPGGAAQPAPRPKATIGAGPAPTGAGGKPVGLVAETDEDFDQGAAALGKFQLRGPDGKVMAVDARTIDEMLPEVGERVARELGSRADKISREERRAMQLRVIAQMIAEREQQAASDDEVRQQTNRNAKSASVGMNRLGM